MNVNIKSRPPGLKRATELFSYLHKNRKGKIAKKMNKATLVLRSASTAPTPVGEVSYIRVREDYSSRSRSRSRSYSPRRSRGSPTYSPARRSGSRTPSRSRSCSHSN